MKRLMAFLVCLTVTSQSFGSECASPVSLLEEGTKAPCRGYLFTPAKELEVRVIVQEHSLLLSEIETLNKIVERLNKKQLESDKILELEMQKTELWKAKAEDITYKYVDLQNTGSRKDMALILLGVGITVLAGWSIGQAAGR